MKKKIYQLRFSLAVFVLFLVLWEVGVRILHIPSYVFPGLFEVLHVAVQRAGDLTSSTLITAGEALGGFVLSVVVGLSVGLFFAVSPMIRQIF